SEDLDFDCKDLSEEEFMAMTDSVVNYLRNNNIDVETRDKPNPRLTAFRRNLYFPQMLFNLGLTGHRDERLLLKVETQNQGVAYQPIVVNINKMGFFFSIQVPPLDVLCAMKFSAILSRQKGRDFYDTIFLLSKTNPNMDFLHAKTGISTMKELKNAMKNRLLEIDLNEKKRDFVHLLFNESNAERILKFGEIINGMQ
ncbi:MAG: nucleotidyl transferase AbiEii/AbiGii toxin family protein, partial [Bacteroidales bacterium]|nr:nucleotidyl transferase AbiEii/AbiGii toxin family protein [Bacteroidales bacterium]